MYGLGCDEIVKKPITMYEIAKLRGGRTRERVRIKDERLPTEPKAKIARNVGIFPSLNGQTFVSSNANQPAKRSARAKAMQIRRAMPHFALSAISPQLGDCVEKLHRGSTIVDGAQLCCANDNVTAVRLRFAAVR